jgi:protein SCO1/2
MGSFSLIFIAKSGSLIDRRNWEMKRNIARGSFRIWGGLALALSSALSMSPLWAADEHANHQMHAAPQKAAPIQRSVVDFNLPSLPMIRQDGKAANLGKEMTKGKPVILAFIYTSCTTICPVTSQILSATQELLVKDFGKLRIVSVSIDPEFDTPERLTAYSKNFKAKPVWQHYTGTLAQSVLVQKSFNAYQGDKMNHIPLIFIGGGDKKSWVRLEGFPTPEQVAKEYRDVSKG